MTAIIEYIGEHPIALIIYAAAWIVLPIFLIGVLLNLFSAIKKRLHEKKQKERVHQEELVLTHSTKTKQLWSIINKHGMKSVFEDKIEIEYPFNSKRSLERANGNDIILQVANTDERIRDLYNKLEFNRLYYVPFMTDVSGIGFTPAENISISGLKEKAFLETEERLFNKILGSIRTDIIINIKLIYRTPKEKYTYSRLVTTQFDGIDKAYTEANRKRAERMAQKVERSKVNDGLRYDVFRRDNFRCVICGASAAEGAELQMDHIIPVSKGGKTELSNLRTLCDRCNRGKSNKYDPYGAN